MIVFSVAGSGFFHTLQIERNNFSGIIHIALNKEISGIRIILKNGVRRTLCENSVFFPFLFQLLLRAVAFADIQEDKLINRPVVLDSDLFARTIHPQLIPILTDQRNLQKNIRTLAHQRHGLLHDIFPFLRPYQLSEKIAFFDS